MLLSEYTAPQLICLGPALPAICSLASNAAFCGVGIRVGIGVIGSLVNVLDKVNELIPSG